jgi:DNA-binding transcriptional MerR regulator
LFDIFSTHPYIYRNYKKSIALGVNSKARERVKKMYTIGQVAELTQITTDTLRYYDKIGLLPFVKRNEFGHRLFSERDLKYLEVIQCLKKSDVPVKEIGQFVEWTIIGDDTLEKRKDFFTEKQKDLEEKISSLESMLAFLKWKKWYYEEACVAETEAIHFVEGTRSFNPLVLDRYNEMQLNEKDKVKTTPRHLK